ncbi:MAG: hypothetical protein LKG25_03540 [Prevotella sp.]|jgi:hypothetical protein|nr:hypothetical protein [Prevotella sp.]MCI1281651.1 hypothetical protein [Prevotella sp.]
MTAFIGFCVLIVVALIGWAIAEVKYKGLGYKVNEEEAAGVAKEEAHHVVPDHELGIKDVIKTISNKGYKAV